MRISACLAIAVLSAVAPAQCGTGSLTTLFAANNGGSPGWGVFFDVNVTNLLGINICGFDTNTGNTAIGVAFTIDAYVTPGSYANVHGVPSAWRLSGTASGTTAGNNVPSATLLARPIYLPPGNYGIALYHNGASVRYTNGTGTNQVYSNADLTMTTGLVRSTFFGTPTAGSVFTPRVWNGTLYYETCGPTSGAGFGFFGSGCAGSLPVSNLQAVTLPQRGGGISVTINNLPQSLAILLLGVSNTTSIYGPLPLDLGPVGATGCTAFVSPDLIIPLTGAANSATFGFGLPNDPALQCFVFYMQALVIDPAANALGAVASDAAAAIIGF